MLRDLPYLDAEGSGDLVEILLLVPFNQMEASAMSFVSPTGVIAEPVIGTIHTAGSHESLRRAPRQRSG
jgi:hypothetical protein